MGRKLLKVCCIASEAEADLAISLGADWLGLVSAMPSGPGPIADPRIAAIAAHVAGRARTVLLTAETEPRAIADHVGRTGVAAAQLVDTPSPDTLRAVRALLPSTTLVPVVHVAHDRDVEAALALDATGDADAILLDSGRPDAAIRELGGTGRQHDWAISARITARCRCPVLLAGGLRAENVGDALARVHPAGIDVCSGVRHGGALDRDRLARLRRAIDESRA